MAEKLSSKNIQNRVTEFLKLQKQQNESGVIQAVPKNLCEAAEAADKTSLSPSKTSEGKLDNSADLKVSTAISSSLLDHVKEAGREVEEPAATATTSDVRKIKRGKRRSVGLSKQEVLAAIDTSMAFKSPFLKLIVLSIIYIDFRCTVAQLKRRR